MGASWRIGVDTSETTALITGGVFRYVRNPMHGDSYRSYTRRAGRFVPWIGHVRTDKPRA